MSEAIDSISPQTGSTVGGTLMNITGKYLYTDANVPASINIAGQPCTVVSFDMTNLLSTRIQCTTGPAVPVTSDNYGNRGILLIRDNVLTATNNLTTATPSVAATTTTIYSASYQDPNSVSVTIWLQGYFNPLKSSDYEFQIVTNGYAVLLFGTSASNTTQIATNSVKGVVTLTANN